MTFYCFNQLGGKYNEEINQIHRSERCIIIVDLYGRDRIDASEVICSAPDPDMHDQRCTLDVPI